MNTEETRLDVLHTEAWNKHIKWLFVRTLDDVAARSALDQTDPYVSMGIAALLRKLYLDKGNLLGEVNRDLRLKVEFALRPWNSSVFRSLPVFAPMPQMILVAGADIDPAIPSTDARRALRVSRDSWLRQVIAEQGKTSMTVKDYIKQVANDEGAVHFGPLTTHKEKSLFQLARLKGGPAGHDDNTQFLLLRALGRISVAAMKPVADALREKVDITP